MSGSIGFGRAALHLGALWSLAFAQPLLDLLGRNGQFFVARGSTAGDILLLAFGYVLVPPLAGAAVVWALGLVRAGLGWAAQLVLVAVCVGGLLLPPAGDALGGSALALAVALVLGAAAAALYARAAAVRSFVGLLAPAPLVVLILFLVFSPVRELVLPDDESGALAGPGRSSTPIVHVVLDELPETTLAHASGELDDELFPQLARFARGATRYRNATTVDDLTTGAVPAQLTGMRPRADSLPTARNHPRSLFTLFERSHELAVIEPITDLCPERLCGEARPDAVERLRSLESDLEVVVQQLLLPADLREGLPPIDRVWEGFAAGGDSEGGFRPGSDLTRAVLDRLGRNDATAGFQRAIAALDRPAAKPPLVFVHSTLPHAAWRFLPDGRRYGIAGKELPGLSSAGWSGPQWQVDQNFQRHVLQVQYTDRLVGRLLDALRAKGLYDKAVIVVSADHGSAFQTGQPRRPVTGENVGQIAPVPLLVKWPGQRKGTVDARAVRTLDVLPTIAKAAGVRLPWRADGMPADERPVDPAAPIDVSHAGEPVLTERLGSILAKRRERERAEAALLRAGVYSLGPRPGLIGRRVVATVSAGGPRATIDDAGDYAAVDTGAAVLPAYVSGAIEGLRANAEVAVAVNGRVEATTRVYRDDGRMTFAAMVRPAALRDGPNAITVLQVLPGDRLRAIGG